MAERDSVRAPKRNFETTQSDKAQGIRLFDARYHFVTICVEHRRLILGKVTGTEVELSLAGSRVEETWYSLPSFYPQVTLDVFVVMPNHVHAVMALDEPRPTLELPNPRRHALSEIVRGFKSMSARAINGSSGRSAGLWQRGFYEHIVRDEDDLTRIREYVAANPINWVADPENPERAALYRR